jgi:hypothetical protein
VGVDAVPARVRVLQAEDIVEEGVLRAPSTDVGTVETVAICIKDAPASLRQVSIDATVICTLYRLLHISLPIT